jgi:hypothetical protein
MLSMPPPDQFPAMARNGDITADCTEAPAKLKPIIKAPTLKILGAVIGRPPCFLSRNNAEAEGGFTWFQGDWTRVSAPD